MKKLSFEEFADKAMGGESRTRPGLGVNYILLEEDGEELFYGEYQEDEELEELYQEYVAL
ncbi:MAG TPA: hypothetical protein GX708_22065 [Gallicola sp.]|jgi:hypothetical protein|nr:hypothetical protein [Gallicola sp.]